jgi:hypothetical protein
MDFSLISRALALGGVQASDKGMVSIEQIRTYAFKVVVTVRNPEGAYYHWHRWSPYLFWYF